jgi:hypothetical protein
MQLLSPLMTDAEDQNRRPIHSTVTPELEAKLVKLSKDARRVPVLQVRSLSAAIARILETADMLGWLDDPEVLREAYVAASAKPGKKK